MTYSLTAIDIRNIVKELQAFKGGRINKFYQLKNSFTLRVNNKGVTKNLNILLPGLIFLSSEIKYAAEMATPLTMGIRKRITNAKINSIKQHGAERILLIEVEKSKEIFFILIEMFSKGNLMLLDKDNKILSLYSTQSWSAREVKKGLTYVAPPGGTGFETDALRLKEVINDFDKPAKLLAVAFGLGGTYAEEICATEKFTKMPTEIKLLNAVKKFLNKPVKAHLYETKISSYKLSLIDGGTAYDSMSEMIEVAVKDDQSKVLTPQEKAVKKQQAVIDSQVQAIKDLKKKIVNNTKKGELIYEHYIGIQKVLDKVTELKKKDWKEVHKFLKGKVKSINKKNKTIIVEA